MNVKKNMEKNRNKNNIFRRKEEWNLLKKDIGDLNL